MIIDTHAHYDDEAFDTDREALLTSMYDGGIEKIVNVCASVGGFQDTVKLMEKYPFVYGAVGIHPDDAEKRTPCDRLSDPDRCDYGGRALSADLLLRSDFKFPDRRSVSAGDAECLLDDQFQRYSGVEQQGVESTFS